MAKLDTKTKSATKAAAVRRPSVAKAVAAGADPVRAKAAASKASGKGFAADMDALKKAGTKPKRAATPTVKGPLKMADMIPHHEARKLTDLRTILATQFPINAKFEIIGNEIWVTNIRGRTIGTISRAADKPKKKKK